MEIFQWLTPDESLSVVASPEGQRAVEDELADILQYVIRMADVLGVDLNAALSNKFEENSLRYPAEEIHGSAAKRPRVSEV